VKEPEEREQRATRAWLRIDLLIAICALLISALTAAASLYQTRVIANQLSSSVWPYLGISVSRDIETGHLSLSIENDGLGPAIVRTVVLTYDGKPVHDLDSFFKLSLRTIKHAHFAMTTSGLSPGQVIRPGQSDNFIDVTSPVVAPLIAKAFGHARLTVCYCSLLEECWSINSDSLTEYPVKMARCGRPGPDEFQIGQVAGS